jgi:hypothetical protein
MPSHRPLTAALAAAALAAAGCGAASTPAPSTTASSTTAPAVTSTAAVTAPATPPAAKVAPPAAKPAAPSAASGSAAAALAALPVKGRAPKTGYSRAQFGDGWADVGGCDTRDRILTRDLTAKTYLDGCRVRTGTLADPYTAQAIRYTRGASEVDIDHVVALSDAWQKGAQQWSPATRVAFANDPLELLAVDAHTNRSKGDGDAATWLPANKSFRCDYVARQVAVKTKYRLSVTQAEKDAIDRVLAACPGEKLPAAGAPVKVTVRSTTPTNPGRTTTTTRPTTSSPGGTNKPISEINCSDFPTHAAAQQWFTAHGGSASNNVAGLDGNHDGVACSSLPAPTPPPPSSSSGGPNKPISEINCSDFPTHAAAQRWFDAHGGSASNNVAGLDGNHDGVACQSLP